MVSTAGLLTLICVVASASSCPLGNELAPCFCNYVASSFEIICPNIENEQVLIQAVYSLRLSPSFFRFTIENGSFRFIPHDIFTSVKFQELQILNSTFVSLTNGDFAFDGLEKSLTSLVIKDSTALSDWDWVVLKNLQYLTRLHVDVHLDIVAQDISKLGIASLKDLSLANNKIAFIHERAFDGFKQLRVLSLRNNMIKDLKRSMFPNPAVSLWHLDFSQNQIELLPQDLFENMPNLASLIINSNKIMTLSKEPFGNIWSRMKHFNAIDNPLRCDCRMEWMTSMKFPIYTNAVCEFPQELQGKKLTELSSLDLWC